MTPREAIKWLGHDTSPAMVKKAEEKGENAVEYINKAIDIAIPALDRARPKRYRMNIDTAVCPVCEHEVESQKMLGDNILFHEQFRYCPNCGQRISWARAAIDRKEKA